MAVVMLEMYKIIIFTMKIIIWESIQIITESENEWENLSGNI